MEKLNFYDFTLKNLEELFISRGEKKFRAAQLFKWVYQFKVTNFDEMTNLSKASRESYKEWFSFDLPKVIHKQVSVDGTRKMLLDVGEGRSVEAVIIPAADRNTLCVSSEVGCNLGCTFCYTGTQKLKKRLSAGEIVGQFLRAQEFLGDNGKVTNIVYMGMGEPLDNCDAVFKSISILQCTSGISLSRRKITVSTSGLVDKIPLVAESGVHLAVSLNGSNDQIRSEIMPINKKWPLKDLLNACVEYSEATNNKVTMEYILLKDKTDSIQDARALHRLTSNVPCKINVIPFNEHPASDFRRPSEKTIQAFQNELLRAGSQAFRRKTMGKDILAACGQLADVKQEASQI